RTLGADLVGMSTALEAIAAFAAGAAVLGISLVTNLAAGTGETGPDHADVLRAGAAAAPRLGALLAGIVAGLAADAQGADAQGAEARTPGPVDA
ncbi:MAG: hypothetical protein ACM3ZF_02975, partial [Mycobacterium leprae]